MRALVTGGAGFIGSHITDALVNSGHTVTVIDDLSRGSRAQVNAAARFVELDITSPEVAAAFAEANPEVVFHAAAQIDVRESVRDPLHDADVNVVGTVNVLRAAVDAGTRRIVFASSGGAIYGDTDVIPTPEEHPCLPASPYGTAKLCAEAYGGTFSRQAGLEFVALRYANVYGPRQDPHGEAGVVAIFATRLVHGEPVVINGDGTQNSRLRPCPRRGARQPRVDRRPRRRLQHRYRRGDRRQHALPDARRRSRGHRDCRARPGQTG